MAIHDLHYSTPPPDFIALAYRLQLLAEMKVGKLVRIEQDKEDAAFASVASQVP